MIEPRNPFRMQTSEQIESDVTFLRLFGPGALDLLPKEDLWNRVHIIRSAPGGGKTSLLRLFTPGALLTLHAHRSSDDFKELYIGMKNIGAIGDEGPRVLGVQLSCSKSNYDSLEDLELDTQHKKRLLYSLLDSRIVLATLHGILDLKRLEYPMDLDRISFKVPSILDLPRRFPSQCTGKDLYQWACDEERAVYEAIDSFGPVNFESLNGHDNLVSAFMLKANSMLYDDEPVVPHVLIMLDDCHKLTTNQRNFLFSIIDQRPPVGVWISERLEALTIEELLSPGAMPERDVVVTNLEESWRPPRGKKFEKIALNIADKRAQFAVNVDIQSFSAYLQDVLGADRWQEKIETAIDIISGRIRNSGESTKRYQEWIADRQAAEGTALERALAWRTIEILIERDLIKNQKTLSDFSPELELQYDICELERRDNSAVKVAAEVLLADEFDFPYYFGASRLAATASSNIEQFLWLGGSLFEEIVSAHLIKPGSQLLPERQEHIIKKAIKERWDQIPYRVRNGRDVKKFLDAIGKFARWETTKPNAPYAPGVTGIAISMRDRKKLFERDGKYTRLSSVISDCIAHNLLEHRLDQKCKGVDWMVLYLNRMLCVHFGLPLQYGGWREKSLNELSGWIEKGFTQQRRGGKKRE